MNKYTRAGVFALTFILLGSPSDADRLFEGDDAPGSRPEDLRRDFGRVPGNAEAAVSDGPLPATVREAYSAFEIGDIQNSIRLFREVLEDNPGSRPALFGLGTVLLRMKEYDEAIRILEPMMEEYPEDFSIFNNLAWLYATATDPDINNPERALNLARKALMLAPRNFHVWNTLSEAHYVSGNYEKAFRIAQQALRLSREQNAPISRQREYQQQVEKARRAHQGM